MKIFRIFDPSLWSIQLEGSENDEFDDLFENWQDPLYLEEFFNENEKDLNSGFFGKCSVSNAVLRTRQEAKSLEQKMRQLATSSTHSLDELFRPLHEPPSPNKPESSKAKGDWPKSWLRIYAIKVQDGVYLVTGGCIKLTRAMQDRPHSALHIKRLEKCIEFLKEEGITDVQGIVELANE